MTYFFQLSRLLRVTGVLGCAFSLSFSTSIVAAEQSQTLILIGSELNSCSRLAPQNCDENTQIAGKSAPMYSVSKTQISHIRQQWPSTNQQNKNNTAASLLALAEKAAQPMTKSELLWLWRDIDNAQLNSLSVQEFNFVFDMLEVPAINHQQQRLTAHHKASLKNPNSANEIMQFINGSLKVASATPSILTITAANRDPYAAADANQGLFDIRGVTSQWLALTPALAKAISSNRCEQLPALRHSEMQLYNREAIYSKYTEAEYNLCKQGIEGIVALINNSTGVYFNGDEQAALRRILFDDNNQAYPWTHALQTRPVIVASNGATAMQSGGSNPSGKVASVLAGSSLSALRADKQDSLRFQPDGGLATFDFGVLDTQFSEQNRTFRLATILDKTQQQHGFGIDSNTALVVIKSATGNVMTVIGNRGVVHLTAQGKQQYSYSYWPAGSVIDINDHTFSLSQRSISQALAPIKIPSLPLQRFGSILTAGKLRSLTQAMCLSQEKSAVAQQDEFLISLLKTSNSGYYRINNSQYGCAISKLALKVSRF